MLLAEIIYTRHFQMVQSQVFQSVDKCSVEHCQLFCRAAPFHEESICQTTNASLSATKSYVLDMCVHAYALLSLTPMTTKIEREHRLRNLQVIGILNTRRVLE